jgi:NIPSNAP
MRTFDPSRDRVVELRQYTLYPGRRDELIELFERVFVEPQDAVGARVLGQYRDADDPDRFVWLRGFDSMVTRHAALTAFYDGAIWRAHREAAVVTMRDSDNVLLLRPLESASTSTGSLRVAACLVLIHDLRGVDAFAAHFTTRAMPQLNACGALAATLLLTESATNTFTRLPVRVDDRVLVCIAVFADVAAIDACLAQLRQNEMRDDAPDDLLPAFMRRPEVLRLIATEARACA